MMSMFTVLPFALAAALAAAPDATPPVDDARSLPDAAETPRALYDRGRCFGAAFGEDEPEFRANCLAKCEGDEVHTVISHKRRIKNKAHWCEYMAKEFCIQRDEDYEDWCWGVPREDDNDD